MNGKLVPAITSGGLLVFKWLLLPILLLNPMPDRLVVENIGEKAIIGDEHKDGYELDAKLQAETDNLLPLFDNMPPVSVCIKDEPVIKPGTNTERGVAYTNCDNHEIPSIVVKKIFYQESNRIQLVNILKHELTHAWLCRQGQISAGHNEKFRGKFKEVGGWGN